MKSAISCLILGTGILFATSSRAAPLPHEASSDEAANASEHNRSLRLQKKTHFNFENPNHVPVADDEDFAYVLMSGDEQYESEVRELRRLVASNLPENVKLVILTTTGSAAAIRRRYSEWIDGSRLIVASDDSPYNNNGFWARDSFPVPVRSSDTNAVSLIAHQYYRNFNSFSAIAQSVAAKMTERNEVFVGGNLLADREGHCFAIDSDRMFDMSSSEIEDIYGCKTVDILDHLAGIGDVDEVIKPIGNKIMLTNQTAYVSQLKSLGYNVVMLPNLKGTFRTYVNALVVGKTVFMPSYGVSQDQQAQKVYENLGYKVVKIRSNDMSDQLHGSIHCQTMAYPAMSQEQLLNGLGLRQLN